MPKLVDSDNFEIPSFLSSIKSRGNQTIPILDEVAIEMKTIMVMQDDLVLRDVLNSDLKTSGNDLGRRFLDGVRFMHAREP